MDMDHTDFPPLELSPLNLSQVGGTVSEEDSILAVEVTPSAPPYDKYFGCFNHLGLKSIPEDLIVLYFNDRRDQEFKKSTLLYVSIFSYSQSCEN
jgi:hypothetical protein